MAHRDSAHFYGINVDIFAGWGVVYRNDVWVGGVGLFGARPLLLDAFVLL